MTEQEKYYKSKNNEEELRAYLIWFFIIAFGLFYLGLI